MKDYVIDLIMSDILNFHLLLSSDEKIKTTEGIRDLRLLESAVNTPFQTFGGEDLYPTVFDKAARLAYGLAKNHGFIDGNKRIAVHAMSVYLFINGFDTDFSQEEIIKIGFDLAESKLSADELSKLLKKRALQIQNE